MDESASISTDSGTLNLNSPTDCTQNHENVSPKIFGRSKNPYGHFCCVPGCPNQRGEDKISGIQRSYYRYKNKLGCW
jgi:hypothetical protein